MENTPPLLPPSLIKIISRFANFYRRLFFNWLLVQLSTKKNYWLRMFAIANPTEILHYEKVKIRQRILL